MNRESVSSEDRSTDRLFANYLPTKDYSFPQKSRIRKKKEYGLLYRRAKRIDFSYGRLWFLSTDVPFLRLGLSVSKKIGGAVVRNRMKRLLRYWFRTQAKMLGQKADLMIQLEPSSTQVDTNGLFDALNKVLKESMQLLQRCSDKTIGEELCSKKS